MVVDSSSHPRHEGDDGADGRALYGIPGGYDSADDGRSAGAMASASEASNHLLTTTYSSTKSSSGFLFDVRSKFDDGGGDVLIDGLDVNVALYPNAITSDYDTNILVYTRRGTHRGYETDVDGWTLWINETLTFDSWGGVDGPTRLPSHRRSVDPARLLRHRGRRRHLWGGRTDDYEIDDEIDATIRTDGADRVDVPLLLPAGTRRSFYVSTPDGPYLRYSDPSFGGEGGGGGGSNRLYYQDERVVLYGEGTAKRAGWDGMTLSPRLFNGGISYVVIAEGDDDDEEVAVDVVPTSSPEASFWIEEDATTAEASSTPSYTPTSADDVVLLPHDMSVIPPPPSISPTMTGQLPLDESSHSSIPADGVEGGGGGTSTSSMTTTTTAPSITTETSTMTEMTSTASTESPSTATADHQYSPVSYYYHCDGNDDNDDGSSIANDESAGVGLDATTSRLRKVVVRYDYDLKLFPPNDTNTTTMTISNSNSTSSISSSTLRTVLGRFEGLLLDYVGVEMSDTGNSSASVLVSCYGDATSESTSSSSGEAGMTTSAERSGGSGTTAIRLGKISSLPVDSILEDDECVPRVDDPSPSSSSSFDVVFPDTTDHASVGSSSSCYPIAGYMTAYYYHDIEGDDDDVESNMRDAIHRSMANITADDDVLATIIAIADAGGGTDDAGGWDAIASGTRVAIAIVDRRNVALVGSGASSRQQRSTAHGMGANMKLVGGIALGVVLVAGLLAFFVSRRRRSSSSRGNGRRSTTAGGGGNGEDEYEDTDEEDEDGGDDRRGYRHNGVIEDEENRGDDSVIIPSRRCGRDMYDGGGGGRYGNSRKDIVNVPDEDDDDEDGDGIGCISLDVGMSEYQRERQRRQRQRQPPSFATEAYLARCDTEATPTISNRTTSRR